jgi:hypothetical protein
VYPQSQPPIDRHSWNNLKFFTWTRRLHDFYEAETRFVFACPTEKEVVEWILKIGEARA